LKPPIYYGWKIVGISFFVDFIAVGFFFYSYGVFFKALAIEFGGSRLDVSIGITLVNVVAAIIAPTIGRALDRFPIKNVILFGCANMTFGFLLLSLIQAQWQLYLILATFIAVGSAAMGGLSTAKLVTNWFITKRGTALGIATMGISLSGVAMPLISAVLIESFGWRIGFIVYGVFTLVLVLPIVLRYVIDTPDHLGLLPDNKPKNKLHIPTPEVQWRTRQALSNRNFWLIVITFGMLFCCMSATLTHMVPRVTDMGFSLIEAAPILSFGAATGVLGKVIYGWITDHYNAKWAIWAAIASQFIGQIMMLDADTYSGLAIGSAIFGFGMGGIVPIHGSIVSALFGQAGFGYIMGLMRPAMMPIMVMGIPFAGWIFDTTGNYDVAFQTFLGLYVVAAIAIGFVSNTRPA
jgi:MFS family permease